MSAIINIEGFVGTPPAKKTFGGREVWQLSVAVNDRAGKDDKPTWYNINVDADPRRADKVMPYIKKGSNVKFVGRLQVRPSQTAGGAPWLDVYASIDLFSFGQSPSTQKTQKQANDETEAQAADIPF